MPPSETSVVLPLDPTSFVPVLPATRTLVSRAFACPGDAGLDSTEPNSNSKAAMQSRGRICLAVCVAGVELFIILPVRKPARLASLATANHAVHGGYTGYGTSQFIDISMNRRVHTKYSKLKFRLSAIK